jgi:hypothetical protein
MPRGTFAASDDDDDDDGFLDENLCELDYLEFGEASSTAPETIKSSPWKSIHDIDKVFVDPPWGSLNVQHGSSERQPLYVPEEEQHYRKRVIRFWDEEEDLEASLDAGGLLVAGGIAAADSSSTVRFMVPKGTDMNTEEEFDRSMSLLDVFGEERFSRKFEGGSKTLGILQTGDEEEGEEDDDKTSVDEDGEEEELRKTLLQAIFGMGFMGVMGYGAKQVMKMLGQNNTDQFGAGDIVGDAVDTAQQTAQQTALNASATSSSSANSSLAAAGVANTQSAAAAAQYVPFRSGVLKRGRF